MYDKKNTDNDDYFDFMADFISKKSKFYHIFNFLFTELGYDVEDFVSRIDKILMLFISKNKKLINIIRMFRIALMSGMFSMEMFFHVKSYVKKQKIEKQTSTEKRLEKIAKILKLPVNYLDTNELPWNEIKIDNEIMYWLFENRIKNDKLRILKFYDINTCKEINKISRDDIKIENVGILIEYDGQKAIIDIKMVKLTVVEVILISPNMCDEIATKIRFSIISEFVKTLDVKNNSIRFSQHGLLTTQPRIKVYEKINQFNVENLISEIHQVLKKGRKRAYAFVGKQGTGKSCILKKIEELFTQYAILYVTPNDFVTANNIKTRFALAKVIQPIVMIIEDLDSFDFKNKNMRVGEFLNQIDDINDDLNMVILVTINDTSLIHPTILDRPGRFDKVFEIKPPQTTREIKDVIVSKASKIKNIYCPKTKFEIGKKLNENLLNLCLENEFTQAEITSAITEQIYINISRMVDDKKTSWDTISTKLFNELFIGAVKSHEETKQAIANYSSLNLNDNSEDDPDEDLVCDLGDL